MIVSPDIESHPKFIGLANKVGDAGRAMLVLLRLWGHCQTSQRGESWGRVSASYVESVARWKGKPGKLFEALCFPFETTQDLVQDSVRKGSKKSQAKGWVEVGLGGKVTVRGWNDFNASLVRSWAGGEATKRKAKARKASTKAVALAKAVIKQSSSPSIQDADASAIREEKRREESTSLPSLGCSALGPGEKPAAKNGEAEPELTAEVLAGRAAGNAENSEAEIPTCEEMKEFFDARGAGVLPRVVERFWDWHQKRRTWLLRDGLGRIFVRDWQVEVVDWQRRDREGSMGDGGSRTGKTGSGSGSGMAIEEELQRIDVQLQGETRETFPGGVERWDGLVKREQELRKVLRNGR